MNIKRFLKYNKKDLFLFILFIFTTSLYKFVNYERGNEYNLYIPLDGIIPFIKEFILIYHSWYPLLILSSIYLFFSDRKNYRIMLIAFIIGQLSAYITFFIFPTIITRQTELGTDFFSNLVRLTYLIDEPYSGLPSLHITLSTILAIGLYKSKLPKMIYYFIFFYIFLITLSIVLVKQHVFLDIPSGILYGIISYIISYFICNNLYIENNNSNF